MIMWERVKKYLNLPSKLCSTLLPIYALLVTILFRVSSTIIKGDPLNFFQKIANIILGEWSTLLFWIGIVLIIVYSVSSILVYIAELKLSENGDFSPCIGTLIEVTKGILQPTLQSSFDITIFKAKDDEKLVFFAGSTKNNKNDHTYPISSTSYDDSWGEIQECWFENCQAISRDRQQRKKCYKPRSKTYIGYKTVIALSIIPFPDNRKTPWGVIRIRTKQQLSLMEIGAIINTIHDNDDGIVNALELLIAKQHLCNHFVKYY